jgi:hypothetical protein
LLSIAAENLDLGSLADLVHHRNPRRTILGGAGASWERLPPEHQSEEDQ